MRMSQPASKQPILQAGYPLRLAQISAVRNSVRGSYPGVSNGSVPDCQHLVKSVSRLFTSTDLHCKPPWTEGPKFDQ